MSTLNKNNINQVFKAFSSKRILIIGDVMIDAYILGNVSRISPEAPVPIVAIKKKEYRLGGAANVALNIKNLEAEPIVCSVIGDDDAGKEYLRLMEKAHLSTEGIIVQKHRPTTIKTRVISSGQQLMRVDEETETAIDTDIQLKLFSTITEIIETSTVDAIVFEDYDKGVLSQKLITDVIALANKNNIPTTVDPKRYHFTDYKGVTLFKPNFKELSEGLNIALEPNNVEALSRIVKSFMKESAIENMVVTLSEYGIFVQTGEKQQVIPTIERSIADVSGAGDTVISVLALGLAAHIDLFLVAAIANLAGGLVCESVGVVPVDKATLQTETLVNLL